MKTYDIVVMIGIPENRRVSNHSEAILAECARLLSEWDFEGVSVAGAKRSFIMNIPALEHQLGKVRLAPIHLIDWAKTPEPDGYITDLGGLTMMREVNRHTYLQTVQDCAQQLMWAVYCKIYEEEL